MNPPRTHVSALAMFLMAISTALATQDLTRPEYEREFGAAFNREKEAREHIAEQQSAIEELSRRKADAQNRAIALSEERFQMLGVSEQDFFGAQGQIASIRQGVSELASIIPGDLAQDTTRIAVVERAIRELRANPVARIRELKESLDGLEQDLASHRSRLAAHPSPEPVQEAPPVAPQPVSTTNTESGLPVRNLAISPAQRQRRGPGVSTYTVKGSKESLYKIAGVLYGDAFEWPLIYRANKVAIDSSHREYLRSTRQPKIANAEDFLVPGQVLVIPQ